MHGSSDIIAEVERETDRLLKYVETQSDLLEYKKKIFSFLYKYSAYSFELIERAEFKSCLYILLKLQTLCIAILQNNSSIGKSEIKTMVTKIINIFENYQKNPSTISFELDNFLEIIQKKSKRILFGLSHDDTTKFYVEILFILAMVLNNLGSIYKLRNKAERAALNFCLAADIMMIFENLMNSFQIYSFAVVCVNLFDCISTEEQLKDTSRVISSSILFMEKLESSIEELGSKADEHYSKLYFYSQFIMVGQVILGNYVKLTAYSNVILFYYNLLS